MNRVALNNHGFKVIAAAVMSLTLAASALAQTGSGNVQPGSKPSPSSSANGQDMVIARAGSQPSAKGPAQLFTGSVRVDPLFPAHAPSTAAGAQVTFEPGARSAWHTHPMGQVLIVTAGVGRVQRWGGPIQEIRPGDVIWTPPGVITHLAFYSGWPNAMAAANAARAVFAERKIGVDQLAPATVELLPLDKAKEDKRAKSVEQDYGKVAPGVVQYTTGVLFRDLWLRPGLAPRDRSMVTVSALVASGQVAQVTYHLNRAMDNRLTEKQASEMLTHLAFYAGWPNVFSAMPVFKDVIGKRAGSKE